MSERAFILDANVWISLAIKQQFTWLSETTYTHKLILYSCPDLRIEFTDVLYRPKIRKYLRIDPNEFIDFFDELVTPLRITRQYQLLDDPKDNYLADLAIQANCKTIVSGDHHLYRLKQLSGIKIISKSKFIDLFKG